MKCTDEMLDTRVATVCIYVVNRQHNATVETMTHAGEWWWWWWVSMSLLASALLHALCILVTHKIVMSVVGECRRPRACIQLIRSMDEKSKNKKQFSRIPCRRRRQFISGFDQTHLAKFIRRSKVACATRWINEDGKRFVDRERKVKKCVWCELLLALFNVSLSLSLDFFFFSVWPHKSHLIESHLYASSSQKEKKYGGTKESLVVSVSANTFDFCVEILHQRKKTETKWNESRSRVSCCGCWYTNAMRTKWFGCRSDDLTMNTHSTYGIIERKC